MAIDDSPRGEHPEATMRSLSSVTMFSLLVSGFFTAIGCGDDGGSTSTGGTGGAGGEATNSSSSSSGSGGGSQAACAQAASMLDVSGAPGAGDGYDKPKVTATCTEDTFVVETNNMPHYTFVQTTPNALVPADVRYELPLDPQIAPTTTPLPLLGTTGFTVTGLSIFGPNEGAVPADEAYGDPVYNNLMDACLGHTAFEYHNHALEEKCLIVSGLVAEPWLNDDPAADEPSPILGWALDGFPIYGPRACSDAECTQVVEMKSGYEQIGDPKSNAWDAYAWVEHAGDATYLDECNGTVGPDGTYRYHATSTFPYILGCYRGTPVSTGGGGGPATTATTGSGMMMPQSCTSPADCVNACGPDAQGCTCANSPMGMICVPTCTTSSDCPTGPGGMPMTCQGGICVP